MCTHLSQLRDWSYNANIILYLKIYIYITTITFHTTSISRNSWSKWGLLNFLIHCAGEHYWWIGQGQGNHCWDLTANSFKKNNNKNKIWLAAHSCQFCHTYNNRVNVLIPKYIYFYQHKFCHTLLSVYINLYMDVKLT